LSLLSIHASYEFYRRFQIIIQFHLVVIRLSLASAKSLVEPGQSNTISDLVILDLLNSFRAALLGYIDRLNFWLDPFFVDLACKIQHLKGFLLASDVRSTHLAAVRGEDLSLELREWLIGETDIVEFAVDVDYAQVLRDVKFVGHVGCVEDEIILKGVRLGPVLVAR